MEEKIYIISNQPYIAVCPIVHKGIPRVRIDIPRETKIMNKIRTISGVTFSGNSLYWHMPLVDNYIEIVKNTLEIKKTISLDQKTGCIQNDIVKSPDKQDISKPIENVDITDKEKLIEKKHKAHTQQNNTQTKVIIKVDRTNKKLFVNHTIDSYLWETIRKTFEKAYWNKERKEWKLPPERKVYVDLLNLLKTMGYSYMIENIKPIEERETDPIVRRYIETMQMRKNSVHTIDAYLPLFKAFKQHFYKQNLLDLTYKEIHEYILNTIKINQLDESQIRQLISAIKYYYEKTEGHKKL